MKSNSLPDTSKQPLKPVPNEEIKGSVEKGQEMEEPIDPEVSKQIDADIAYSL